MTQDTRIRLYLPLLNSLLDNRRQDIAAEENGGELAQNPFSRQGRCRAIAKEA
jgi:hypothetical protein